MHPLLKRILTNSLIAGSLLAVMGVGLTELARMWLIAQSPTRADPNAPATPAGTESDVVSYRIPLMMATYGVGFVVLAELFLWFVLKRRPKPPAAPAPPPGPDPAELLLEQLMREAEAKQAAAHSTPSEPVPENSRITPTLG
ncbi:MAG: hypothetical protein U0804_17055 [Gemmataceae bacterium]